MIVFGNIGQFITFSQSISDSCIALPMSANYQTSFFFTKMVGFSDGDIEISITDTEGNFIASDAAAVYSCDNSICNMYVVMDNTILASSLSDGQCFRIKVIQRQQGGTVAINRYSNLLKYVANQQDFAFVEYRCYEDAFGVPFSSQAYIEEVFRKTKLQQLLPIRLTSPQFAQTDKVYEKQNGEVITLYAQYYKEWSGITEYLPEDIHEKIVAALSCDEVYINGTRVTKTDNYQIDWDNYNLDCDGMTKLARATFKVRSNITQRNSNY